MSFLGDIGNTLQKVIGSVSALPTGAGTTLGGDLTGLAGTAISTELRKVQQRVARQSATRGQQASFPVPAGQVQLAGIELGIGDGGLRLDLGPGVAAGPPLSQIPDIGAGSMATASGLATAFRPVRSSMTGAVIGFRANSLVAAVNPGSGALTFFRHVGKPILFQGDARICRGVRKSARKALRASGG